MKGINNTRENIKGNGHILKREIILILAKFPKYISMDITIHINDAGTYYLQSLAYILREDTQKAIADL